METPSRNMRNISETEDLCAVAEANKRLKTEESSNYLPFDLMVEIFLKLPTKSLAKCGCVSKRWATYLRDPYFTDLFLTRSSSRPKLLFACNKDGHLFFFSSSSPQPHDDENSSLSTENCYRMKIPCEFTSDVSVSAIRGLVFLRVERGLKGKAHLSLICNPSTGESLILPKVKSRRKIGVTSYFTYDPVEKQYKVLSMTWHPKGNRWQGTEEHQVLTLGGGESSWRKIECSIHYKLITDHHVCIDGVLYYPARTIMLEDWIIVFFDVRSEKFRRIEVPHLFDSAPLVNYNGKLALLGGSHASFRLCVLEDVKKQEWSERKYVLPERWKNVVWDESLHIVGMTRTNEIVLCSSSPQYLLYYNTERNTVVRVDIQGMEAVKRSEIFTFLDHIEDARLMKVCFKS